jgi:hypothetical protein
VKPSNRVVPVNYELMELGGGYSQKIQHKQVEDHSKLDPQDEEAGCSPTIMIA